MNARQLYLTTIAGLVLAVPPAIAADDDNEIPFSEGRLFFELNDTDGDLGLHGKVDGDEWFRMKIADPNERRMMTLWTAGRLRRQGVTELFFESAEPNFDDLDPAVFFKRFPEGWYEINGRTLDFEPLESETFLNHIIPAAPVVSVNGEAAAGKAVCGCDEEDLEPGESCPELPEFSPPIVLGWGPVTTAHAQLGRDTGSVLADHDISVVYYEVVAEIDDTPFKSTSILPAEVNSWTLPEGLFGLLDDEGEPYDEIKFEILVRIDSGQYEDDDGDEIEPDLGNKSAVESCFALAD